MSRARLRLPAVIAASALALTGLLLPVAANADPDPAPAICPEGAIAVNDAVSGAHLGYVAPHQSAGFATVGNASAALNTRLNGANIDVIDGSPDPAKKLGFKAGVLGEKLGGKGYVWLFAGPERAAGSVPVGGTETAVWTLDDGQLRAKWINPDHTEVPLTFYHKVSEDSAYIGATGDLASLREYFHSETLDPITLTPCKPQAIGFTSTAPAVAYPEGTYDVAASGGASGNPVTFSSATPLVCSVATARVTFLAAGTCMVTADQAGNGDYLAAPQATQAITVTRVASTVSVSVDPASSVSGQTVTSRAVVTSAVGDPAGTVQFRLNGANLGVPQPVSGDGTVSYPALPVSAGTHRVTAEYLPSNTVRFAGSSNETSLVVAKAATTTELSNDGTSLKAAVAPVGPGAGTPSGDVEFFIDGDSVGTSSLSGGVATLAYRVPAGTHVLSASYEGGVEFLGSVASTSKKDPAITAQVSSAGPPRAGWYRSPVTIRYSCTPGSAPLAGPCPAAVTVAGQGGSTISRTVEATDGGLAMVSTVVNIDRTRPWVSLSGVRAGGRYFASGPRVLCVASDPLSGVASCTVQRKRHRHGKVTVIATATDRAGNRATVKKSYVLVRYAVAGASWSRGAWTVRKGQTYTLLAQGPGRPRYVYAAPGRPHGGNVPFVKAGKNRWALGATMSMTTRGTRVWHLGIKDRSGLHIVKVRVIG